MIDAIFFGHQHIQKIAQGGTVEVIAGDVAMLEGDRVGSQVLDRRDPELRAGIVAPAVTPRPVVDRLNAEVTKALALPEVRNRLIEQGAEPVVVLGYDVWQRQFLHDPAIIGRVVTVGCTPRTVVGVMPPRFGFPRDWGLNHYWTPGGVTMGGFGGPDLRSFEMSVPISSEMIWRTSSPMPPTPRRVRSARQSTATRSGRPTASSSARRWPRRRGLCRP